MRTLARFDAPEDAYLLHSFLGSRGIDSAVLDEHVAQLFWHYRQATGGVRVVIGDNEDWVIGGPLLLFGRKNRQP